MKDEGEKMSATVGIITYRRPQMLKKCLRAVRNQTVKPEEIVIIKGRMPQPVARNKILKRCKTEIIAYLDDDAVPTKHWLENIVKGYSDSEIAGVTGPAISVDENFVIIEKIIHNPKNRNFFKSTGDIRCDSRRWIPPEPVETQIMIGANMSFRASKLREVGGFDEHYKHPVAYREETDPQIALIRKGYKFLYEPKALVWHIRASRGGISGEMRAPDYFHHCGRNHKYLCGKYFSKLKSRLSWVFWSKSPPCLWLCVLLAVLRRDRRYLGWIRGLWCKS